MEERIDRAPAEQGGEFLRILPARKGLLITTICLKCPAALAMSHNRDVLKIVETIHSQFWHSTKKPLSR